MTQILWRKRTEWPLLGVALIFLAAYSIQVIGNVSTARNAVLEVVIWVTWGLFGVDYFVNLVLAPNRGRWFVRNLHELVILGLPVLRPLRLLRLVALLRVVGRIAGNALRGRILAYVIGSALLLVYVGALAVLDAEENAPGGNIKTFGDALWWAVTTITTVGYGDHYPVTVVGRFVATGLMIGGIAVLGVVTASVASWLVEQVGSKAAAEMNTAEKPLHEEIARLTDHIERLSAKVDQLVGEDRR